ncbi:MAG: hypothetical protein ACOX19_12535 [Fermentimonas sp.]
MLPRVCHGNKMELAGDLCEAFAYKYYFTYLQYHHAMHKDERVTGCSL